MLSLEIIERQAMVRVNRITAQLRKRAFRYLRNPTFDFIETFDEQLADLIADQQALFHMAASHVAASSVLKFNDELEASTGLKFDEVKDIYATNALRVARNTTDNIETSLRNKISDANLKRVPRSKLVADIEKSFNQNGIPGFSTGQVNTIVTTQLLVAKAAGEWNTYEQLGDDLWGFKYVTAGDDRVRPAHEAMDGTTLPKNDPFWQVAYPPNGYNCRCEVLPIFGSRRKVRREPQPDNEFRFNPGEGYRTRVPGKLGKSDIDLKVKPKPLTARQVQELGTVNRLTSGVKEYSPVLDRAISRSRVSKREVVFASVDATDYNFNALNPGATLTLNKHVVAKNRQGPELNDETQTLIRIETKPGDVAATLDPNTTLISGKRPYTIKKFRKRKGVNIITLIQE